MWNSRSSGVALIAAGLVLFGVLLYEPANIVEALGVGNFMDEARVVLICLAIVAGCVLAGVASLRSNRRPELAELDEPT